MGEAEVVAAEPIGQPQPVAEVDRSCFVGWPLEPAVVLQCRRVGHEPPHGECLQRRQHRGAGTRRHASVRHHLAGEEAIDPAVEQRDARCMESAGHRLRQSVVGQQVGCDAEVEGAFAQYALLHEPAYRRGRRVAGRAAGALQHVGRGGIIVDLQRVELNRGALQLAWNAGASGGDDQRDPVVARGLERSQRTVLALVGEVRPVEVVGEDRERAALAQQTPDALRLGRAARVRIDHLQEALARKSDEVRVERPAQRDADRHDAVLGEVLGETQQQARLARAGLADDDLRGGAEGAAEVRRELADQPVAPDHANRVGNLLCGEQLVGCPPCELEQLPRRPSAHPPEEVEPAEQRQRGGGQQVEADRAHDVAASAADGKPDRRRDDDHDDPGDRGWRNAPPVSARCRAAACSPPRRLACPPSPRHADRASRRESIHAVRRDDALRA